LSKQCYKLPLRLANNIITSGPAAKIKSTAANCKKISKFISFNHVITGVTATC
jgi:hypothetical protein